MDAKDLRTESTLGSRSHDGSNKYSQSATAITCNRNKSYHEVGSHSLGKVEVPSSRPCAVIGPDRVVPPSAAAEPFPKKPPPDQWMFADPLYRRPPDYPMKMSNYQNQTRNISPRQTFQENMQRIMMPPTYNSIKITKDQNLPGDGNLVPMPKSSKMNVPTEAKYCDVPYNVSPLPTEQKNIRDVNVPSVSAINQSAPYGWNASNTVRPSRPYGASELYQYPEYTGSAGSRTMPVGRPVRNFHEETSSVFPERFFSDGNIRYKPYPPVKEGYPQPRYECINNYPNPYHPPPYPPPRYDIQKSHNPHLYSTYSQVPVKYFENRMADPVIDGYQRPNPQPNYNVSYPNQFIHPAYGSVPGNCLQNKLLPYPSDMPIKANTLNKLAYENKFFADFENARNKPFVPENYYGPKSQIMISKPPHASNIQNASGHPYYRKDYQAYRNYDSTKYAEMASNISNASLRFPSQFSPNVMGMSPLDSNDQLHGLLLEDNNYVNHPSVSNIRVAEQSLNRIHPDMYTRHDHKFAPMRRPMPSRNDTNNSSNVSSKDKKNIDVRQFLQQWNDDDDNNITNNPRQEIVQNTTDAKLSTEQEQLYVLGLVNVPSEELGKYDHIQKISKLPDNIKGYNSLELLNQFEEAIECSNMNINTTTKPRDYQRNFKTMPIQRATVPPLQRPISPLDVESKISQSVIHKEVGCNFEIKPCSPKMSSVEIAAPVQTVLNERVIEKLSNPHVTKSPNNPPMVETLGYKGNGQDQDITNNKNPSCKMNQNQFNTLNYTVPTKSNYSLSDLESSSGVCLASLPRLDNEIELNFPEVNQQFINANTKTDTVITTTNSETPPDIIKPKESVLVSPGQLSPNMDIAPKLCKFRKSKKEGCELNSEVINHAQAVRTDSVIIKNPDTVKEFGCSNNSAMIFTNLDLQNSDKIDNDDGKDHNIALDFSVNKYSFGYDVNNKLDDLYDNKIINSPNICETTDNKQELILEPVPIAEIVTKDNLNPEKAESEMETKIQDSTFLVESSDLGPEQKDIDKSNFADVNLPSDNDSDTGSSDDSNTQFCEDNIISFKNVKKETVEDIDLEKSCFVIDTNQNTLKLIDTEENKIEHLNEEGSKITDVQPASMVDDSSDNSENLIESKSFNSPTTRENNIHEESDNIAFNKEVGSKTMMSENEQVTLLPIESSKINEIEDNNVHNDNLTTTPKPATDDTIICSKSMQNSILSEEHEHEITQIKDAEYVSTETIFPIDPAKCNKDQTDKTENKIHLGIKKINRHADISLITGICFTTLSLEICNKPLNNLNDYDVGDREEPKFLDVYNQPTTNIHESKGYEKVGDHEEPTFLDVCIQPETNSNESKGYENIDDCEEPIFLNVCNQSETNSNESKGYKKIEDCEEPTFSHVCDQPETNSNESMGYEKIYDREQPKSMFSTSKENSSTEECKQIKINYENDIITSSSPPSNECKTFSMQNIDGELNNIVDISKSQNLTEYFEEEEKQLDHSNVMKTQDSNFTEKRTQILPLKLVHYDTDNSSDSDTFVTESVQTESSVKITPKLSEIAPICLTGEITGRVDNEMIKSLDSASAFLNGDRFQPSSDLNSDNNNITVIGDSMKQMPYRSIISNNNVKHFCIKLFSPQIYNLTIYESGICTTSFKMNKNPNSEAKSNTADNVEEILNTSDVFTCDLDTSLKTTNETMVSMVKNNQVLKSVNFIEAFNSNIQTAISNNSLNLLNDQTIPEKLTLDNKPMSPTYFLESELFQVVSLKNIVTKFLDIHFPNIDLKEIQSNFKDLETSFPTNIGDTTEMKNNVITKPLDTDNNIKNKHNHEKIRRYLKRSLSESDLGNYEDMENSQSINNIKRQKVYTKNDLETELIAGNIFLHNNRRNSISTFINEEDGSFCILIDDNCIIAEECEHFDRNSTVEESECFEYVETELDMGENDCDENIPCLLPISDLKQTKYSNNDILNNFNEHQSDEGTWIEDVACVETVVSDNVAEDIEVRSVSSPLNESISDYNSDGESSYTLNNNFNDHAEKVKHIYEGCHDNDRLVETLFRTPQMNVNKTLVKENQNVDHCIDQERADLENMLSESMSTSKTTVSDVTTLARDSLIEARNLAPHTFNEEMLMVEENHHIDTDDDSQINSNIEEKSQNAFVHSCESSYDNVFTYNELTENTRQYSSSSSSPEVSSTTSEEKCSSILLKITSYNGSIVSEISNSREIKRISCKYTEKNDYNSASSNRPLITKAAQKYIPPISETIQDLKVKLPLPQHSLLKLQQLKHSKEQLKLENNINNRYFPLRPDKPKKPKPKFEDVLKSIDEIQFKMHKEKNKKIKKYIPKVVIKKNGNGSHYTSSSSHESFDPDLTGLKWQPWVFLERNGFIDKMATTRKTEAIYSHRKNEFVFRDKFHKYKSVSSAKFVITQPKLDDKGQLKYTIKLKHNY